MRFTAELMLVPLAPPGATSGARIADLARRAEASGFDAVGFNDHPAPSKRWLDAGGHEAFDPFAALGFCAAVTSRLRLMPFLAVIPYRNPYLLAKSVATVDALSGGRLVLCAGSGYLRAEFGVLGVEFDQRNEIFDQTMEVFRKLWTDQEETSPVSRPLPAQLPHPPVWIGGNSRLSRRRAAAWGQGWSPMLAGDVLARTARTALISTIGELRSAIDDLRSLTEQGGRDPSQIEVQVNGTLHSAAGAEDLPAAQYLETVHELEEIGVTQTVVHLELDDSHRPEETIESFGSQIIARQS